MNDRSIKILTGLYGMHYFRWAMAKEQYSSLPNYYIERYSRLYVYGVVQISVGKKHSLNKIVVNLIKSPNEYTCMRGTKVLLKDASFVTALAYFQHEPDSQPDIKLEQWKRKYGKYATRYQRRQRNGS